MYEKCKSEYLLMFTASENEDIDTELFETSHLAGMQITIVNIFRLSLSTKMLPKVMFSWKSQLICSSITNLHSNVCNFYSSIWLRYLSIDVFLNDNIQINTTVHFSFPFRLIFLSIDFFLNQSIHLRPTYYFSLFLSSRIDIVINWYFSQSLNTDICNYI